MQHEISLYVKEKKRKACKIRRPDDCADFQTTSFITKNSSTHLASWQEAHWFESIVILDLKLTQETSHVLIVHIRVAKHV